MTHFLVDILLKFLYAGYENLKDGGRWAKVWPETIVETINRHNGRASLGPSQHGDRLAAAPDF